jgi:hypothetical protein
VTSYCRPPGLTSNQRHRAPRGTRPRSH